MDWIQVFTIVWTVVTLFGVSSAFMFYLFNKLDADIKTIASRLDAHMNASNARLDAFNARLDASNARLDTLHTIIIDMLKARPPY